MTQKLYSLPRVAKECKLSLSMIHRAIEDGDLAAIEVEGTTDERVKRVVTEDALQAYKRWRVATLGDYYPELDQAQ
jgi:hypothetical protein